MVNNPVSGLNLSGQRSRRLILRMLLGALAGGFCLPMAQAQASPWPQTLALAAALPTPGHLDDLSGSLAKKLDALGSFQAEYQAVSPTSGLATVSIVFNQGRRYCLIEIGLPGDKGPKQRMLLDYSMLNKTDRSFQLLLMFEGHSQKFNVKFKDMFERPDNPIGSAFLISQYFRSDHKLEQFFSDGTGAAMLNLGLSSEQLMISLGVSTHQAHLIASWLDADQIHKARSVKESATSVELNYPNQHQVVIDARTGLLLRDSWPDLLHPGQREIKYLKHGKLSKDVPFTELIPDFAKIHFDEQPGDILQQQFYFSFLNDLGTKIAADKAFAKLAAPPSDKVYQDLRSKVRQIIHGKAWATAPAAQLQAFSQQVLIPAWKKFQQAHPDQAKKMTFQTFLDTFMQECEARPTDIVAPGASEFGERFINLHQNTLNQLSVAAGPSIARLNQLGLQAVLDAWLLEYMSSALTQVKAMKLN